MPVGIDIDQLHPILFYVSFTLPDLAFDRLVCLAGPGRVSCIDNSPFHHFISGLTHTSRRLGFFIFVTEQKAFDDTESLATVIRVKLTERRQKLVLVVGYFNTSSRGRNVDTTRKEKFFRDVQIFGNFRKAIRREKTFTESTDISI